MRVGAPLQLLDSIATRGWQSPAALSANGTLLYQRGGLASRLVRVDQHGTARVVLDSARVVCPSAALPRRPPGRIRIAGGYGNEIWIADLAAQTAERLTRDGFNDRPEWTPDGSRVMYAPGAPGRNSLWWQTGGRERGAAMLFQAAGRDPGRGLRPGRRRRGLPDGHAGQQPRSLPATTRREPIAVPL